MDVQEAYAWASRRCAQREMCPADIEKKLRERETAERDIAAVIDRLIEEGFVDEARYAQAFANDKIRFDHWGRRKVSYALRLKQIPQGEIRRALAAIDEEEYRAMLRQVLLSKRRTTHADSARLLSQKLIAFALRRGFEPDLIYETLGDEAFALPLDDD